MDVAQRKEKTNLLTTWSGPDLILPANIRWVHHPIAPVLLPDLVLFFPQEGQLFVAAMHIIVKAVQVVATPLRIVLKESNKIRPGKSQELIVFLCEQVNSPAGYYTVSSGRHISPEREDIFVLAVQLKSK